MVDGWIWLNYAMVFCVMRCFFLAATVYKLSLQSKWTKTNEQWMFRVETQKLAFLSE